MTNIQPNTIVEPRPNRDTDTVIYGLRHREGTGVACSWRRAVDTPPRCGANDHSADDDCGRPAPRPHGKRGVGARQKGRARVIGVQTPSRSDVWPRSQWSGTVATGWWDEALSRAWRGYTGPRGRSLASPIRRPPARHGPSACHGGKAFRPGSPTPLTDIERAWGHGAIPVLNPPNRPATTIRVINRPGRGYSPEVPDGVRRRGAPARVVQTKGSGAGLSADFKEPYGR